MNREYKGYEKIWNEVYGHSRDPIRTHVIYPLLKDEIVKLTGKKILDLGCGNGSLIRQLQKFDYQFICGIDRSEEFLNTAKKQINNYNTSLLMADIMEKLPLANSSFDGVFMVFVINELHSLRILFNEINRVLIHNGSFHIIMTHPFLILKNYYYEKYTGKKNNKFIGKLKYKNRKLLKYILSTAKVQTPFYQYTFEDIFKEIDKVGMKITTLKELDTSSNALKNIAKYQEEKYTPKYLYLKLIKIHQDL